MTDALEDCIEPERTAVGESADAIVGTWGMIPVGKLAAGAGLGMRQLERRFIRDEEMGARVHRGVVALQPLAGNEGVTHPEVLAGLGKLYADTVSHLRPRVMVQGNPHYLAQADVVAEIRAVLLAALRSAVLWRQLGGSFWDLVLRRGEIAAVAGHPIDSHIRADTSRRIAERRASDEAKEGLSAFLEKRKPKWAE